MWSRVRISPGELKTQIQESHKELLVDIFCCGLRDYYWSVLLFSGGIEQDRSWSNCPELSFELYLPGVAVGSSGRLMHQTHALLPSTNLQHSRPKLFAWVSGVWLEVDLWAASVWVRSYPPAQPAQQKVMDKLLTTPEPSAQLSAVGALSCNL